MIAKNVVKGKSTMGRKIDLASIQRRSGVLAKKICYSEKEGLFCK